MSPDQELRYLILAAQREGSRMLAASLRRCGLTAAQAEVLQVLARFAPVRLRDLGDLLICENGSPSRLVKGLVDRGYVTRSVSKEDGRELVLELSGEGVEALQRLAGADDALVRHINERLSSAEIEDMAENLRKLLLGTQPGRALEKRRQALE